MDKTSQEPSIRKGVPIPVPEPKHYLVSGIREAVDVTGFLESWIRKAIVGNPLARDSGRRINVGIVREWVENNREALEACKDELPIREKKVTEEWRKLKIANDQKIGTLIERAWMAERIHRFAGDMNAIRIKAESEDVMLFAAAGDDVPRQRTEMKALWDRIFASIRTFSQHFEE